MGWKRHIFQIRSWLPRGTLRTQATKMPLKSSRSRRPIQSHGGLFQKPRFWRFRKWSHSAGRPRPAGCRSHGCRRCSSVGPATLDMKRPARPDLQNLKCFILTCGASFQLKTLHSNLWRPFTTCGGPSQLVALHSNLWRPFTTCGGPSPLVEALHNLWRFIPTCGGAS